ncbi:molecular chaperone [Psychromonas sp. MB-3u-54]|uniref:fimbrial biogenesis chaperone n=1 Tax=Psychromonas sp. MB-3u-54 TaxID=2058319 RepID=UPI000C333088|nr:fimbria/pilus periplasmic chaperone [Psychromonas sp. MB-3u-54]PKH03635.1 molecular chaperone [Psychromonas sp. MB-3u-54]
MKKYAKALLAISLAVCSASSFAAFSVTRTSMGVNLEQPVTKETTLINSGNKPVRVKVDFAKPAWAKDKYYLGDQLVAYPRIVVIPPKGKIQVKVAPRIKKDLQDGEYVALLVFKELPPRGKTEQVTVLMNVGVPYYGRKGKLETGLDFDALRVEKADKGYNLLGTVKNSGNFSYPLNINITFYKNKKLIKEQSFKQGFYREYVLELKKSTVMDKDADYVQVVFANKQLNFSEKFDFQL